MNRSSSSFTLTREQQKLAEANINLARNVAWKYQRSTGIEYLILESAAFEGLCQAAARYDANRLNEETGRSMKFSSLAVPYIRGSILHYIRDKTYAMRLTHRMREQWVKGRKMLNKGMTDIEICRELDISLSDWQDTKTACSGPPLELKDISMPDSGLEASDPDHLEAFRQQATQVLAALPDTAKARLERFCHGRSPKPGITLPRELAKLL